jgi:hypothetical protein
MRVAAATAAYFFTLGGVAAAVLCDIAGLSETATVLVAGPCILGVHVGYGAMTRTYWACAVCLVPPIGALLLAPNDPDMPSYPLALAFGLTFVAPWVAGLIGAGVALGQRRARRVAL